ncbi:hypothetical protein QJS10_CPA08g01385 [Acorus calamus]|uniref:Reverse transcriptase domain-containing protein n=1 Tax=Acorus calamus TaxID=4465 RepID=A0AAV9E977_ACOCL|nr:hypothetical protein QJS10_CPA08g01385 [Acorus calamus]
MFAAKIDLASAYDSVEWGSIESVLQAFGFPQIWIRWIMQCVTRTRAAVLINGTPSAWISQGRGLRQGDPLSPYLFVLVTEVISALIHREQREGRLLGYYPHPRFQNQDIYPALNHILYADDLLIVGIAKPSQCVLIRDILKEAQKLTAQINESTLLQLEKVIRGFLWSDGINLRPIHLVHWEAITAERSRGGLGIRRLTFLKKAILAKLAFRFLLCPSLVGQHMHIKYNWVVNPWEVSPRKNSSSVWKALCKGLQLIRLHVRLIPGDLGSTNLLKDPWFMPVPFSRIPTFINMEEARLDCSISDVVQNNQWSVSILKRVLPDYWIDQIKLQLVPNITQDGRPRWVWKGSCSDKPSTRELYTLLNPLPRSHEEVGWKMIWRIPVIPKVQIFVWKLAWESVNSSTHEAGAAFVVYARDVNSLNGRVVGAGFTGWPWSAPIRMEAEAIRLGVQFARKKGLQNLVELISLLQGRMNGPAALQQTISAIRECDLSEDKIIFCKVNRTHVRAAKVLALHARWTQEHAISDALSNDSIRSLLLPVMDSIKECIVVVIGELNFFGLLCSYGSPVFELDNVLKNAQDELDMYEGDQEVH